MPLSSHAFLGWLVFSLLLCQAVPGDFAEGGFGLTPALLPRLMAADPKPATVTKGLEGM